MAAPQRLTRRFQARMSETAFRRLRKFAAEMGMSEDEAMTFLFENIDGILHPEQLPHRLGLYRAAHAKRAGKSGGA